MGYIADFLNERLTAKTVDLLINDTQIWLKTRNPVLEEIAPVQEFSSRNFLGLLAEEKAPIASVIGFGGEIPTLPNGQFRKLDASMLKIGASYVYDENKQWEMAEAMKLSAAFKQGIADVKLSDGRVIPGANNDLARIIYGNTTTLARSVMDALNVMTYQVLQTGQISTNNQYSATNNILFSIDYRDSRYTSDLFPTPCVANGVGVDPANVVWTDYENANGLQCLYNMVDKYVDINGHTPDYIIMGRKALNHLKQQKSTKDAATSVRGTSVGTVSSEMLMDLMLKRDIILSTDDTPIKIVDDQYELLDYKTGEIVKGRFLNENTICLVKKGMGMRAIGPTLESSVRPVNGGDHNFTPKSGLYLSAYESRKIPITDTVVAIMTALPIFAQGKYLSARVVF